jgi:hypothetical protein
MIWAMQEIADYKPGQDSFYDHSEVDETKDIMKQINAIKLDDVGLNAYNERLQKGCELFGKYFQALWD